MSLVAPEVDLARNGRNVVMTLTYESEIAAKHASDAMATNLVKPGGGVVTRPPVAAPARSKLSKQEKTFAILWCAGNTATSVVALLAAGNAVALLALIVLLLVNGVMLLVAVA